MEKNEIIEGNKLIAEFDGMRYVNDDPEAYPYGYMMSEDTGAWDLDHLEYHESWDWLMPVVEKIESMGFNFYILKNLIVVTGGDYLWNGGSTSDSKIISVWHGVVQFIKWHNAQQK